MQLTVKDYVGIVGAIIIAAMAIGMILWPLIKPTLTRRYVCFWLVAIAVTVSRADKPTPPPQPPAVEGIKVAINQVWSNKVKCSWTIDGTPTLTGKRVIVRVNNVKMNGWQTVFVGDAAEDTSCTFPGFYVDVNTAVKVEIEDALTAPRIHLEVEQ